MRLANPKEVTMQCKYASLAEHHRTIDRARWWWGMHVAMYAFVFARAHDEICERDIAF